MGWQSAIKELNAEYAQVLAEKKKTYSEYRQARQEMKDYVAAMAKKDPAFRQKMLGALQDAGLDGWAPLPGTEGRRARR